MGWFSGHRARLLSNDLEFEYSLSQKFVLKTKKIESGRDLFKKK